MKELMAMTIAASLLIVLAIGSALGIRYLLGKNSCKLLHRDTQIETKYEFWNGCYVKVNGRFIPQNNWRGEYQQ